MATNPKTYVYHSYKNSVFKGILTNVISDFAKQQEINSAGSTITVVLGSPADSYSEGSLIDFNNDIQIYEIDDGNPNGSLIFRGFIVNYKPVFTSDNKENVQLTIMGYGATLNDYIIESGEAVDVNQNSNDGNTSAVLGVDGHTGSFTDVIQSFTVGGGITKLSAVEFYLAGHQIDDLGNSAFLQVFTSQSDAEGGGTSSVIATALQTINSLTATAYKFTFATPVTITPGNRYWCRLSYNSNDHLPGGIGDPGYVGQIDVYYNSTKPLSAETMETVKYNGVSWNAPVSVTGSTYIKTYSSSGATTSVYSSQDPSAILKSIIDNYNLQGGKITYTPASIDSTNTQVSYTFNCNTVYEGIQKCLQMAPVGWYFYIDEINNVLHFHKISGSATHTFTMSKNIQNLSVEKRAQDIVNVVYFIGGPTGGVNLYNKYVQQTSVDIYGRHAIRYTDNNVTQSSTAQIIANSILSNQGQVELRIEMDILDDGGQGPLGLGFDIESVTLGESISFRSMGASSGGSLWDVAKWDINKWDFDITDLSSVVVQVTRIDYTPDVLHLALSTVPPDITKRVQDIYRNLQQVNNLSNPTTPS